MKAQLTPSWLLTTDHAQGSYGIPVLMNHQTSEVCGPGDILQPYPHWGFMPAAMAVKRMSKCTGLSDVERDLVGRFCGVEAVAKSAAKRKG